MKENYEGLAKELIENVGGWGNVESLTHCTTRLRFAIMDRSKVDFEKLKSNDEIITVIETNGQLQVVIGIHVSKVFEEIMNQREIKDSKQGAEDSKESNENKKNFSVLDIISSIFAPVLSGMTAAGILKGLLIMLSTLGVVNSTEDIYVILFAASDAIFYFLPLALAITSARKFKANQFVSFAIVSSLLYPSLVSGIASDKGLELFSFSIPKVTYSNSVIPVIIIVFVLSQLEKQLKKIIPELVSGIFIPFISLIVMVPLALLIIGPSMTWVGEIFAAIYTYVYTLSPPIAGMIMGGIGPLLVMVGAHMALIPISINNMALYGADTMSPVTTGANFAIAGAALAVALKTKNKQLKELGYTTSFSAFVGGVTEPAIYGIILKYKKPLYVCLASTALGGLVAGIAQSATPTIITTSIITLPAMATFQGGWGFVSAASIGLLGGVIGTYFFGFDDTMLQEKGK